MTRLPRTHGTGEFRAADLRACPPSVVWEPGAMIFHPENVSLGERVYVGHYAILKGYYQNQLVIGDDSWIGQSAFLHAAGGLAIGRRVGIGPHATILTSQHQEPGRELPIMDGALDFSPVEIGDGCDLGAGCVIVPGVRLGVGVQVGAGAVVTKSFGDYAVVVGNPARLLRMR
jgi:acetyltransferase-like isoleucine patch superfamily enzyme